MPKEGAKPGYVEEDEGAWEAAHAEKPHQDALVDYKNSLSKAGKLALEWVASQEGEKALEKYRSAQKEDPEMRILRERALATLELPESARRIVTRRERVGKIDDSWAARCKYGLREFGKGLIEEIIRNQQMDATRKRAELERLGSDLGTGIGEYVEGKVAPEITLRPENILWGYIIAGLMDIGSTTSMDMALKKISFKTKTPEGSLVQKHFDFFERARRSYPEIGKNLDPLMEKYKWLWDETQKKYISIQ